MVHENVYNRTSPFILTSTGLDEQMTHGSVGHTRRAVELALLTNPMLVALVEHWTVCA